MKTHYTAKLHCKTFSCKRRPNHVYMYVILITWAREASSSSRRFVCFSPSSTPVRPDSSKSAFPSLQKKKYTVIYFFCALALCGISLLPHHGSVGWCSSVGSGGLASSARSSSGSLLLSLVEGADMRGVWVWLAEWTSERLPGPFEASTRDCTADAQGPLSHSPSYDWAILACGTDIGESLVLGKPFVVSLRWRHPVKWDVCGTEQLFESHEPQIRVQ